MSGSPTFEAYFDFDNTITPFDVLDDVIQRFSIDEDWRRAEHAWEAGEIGSRECLERQLAGVRVAAPVFRDYLATVPVDPAFPGLLAWLRERAIEPVIVSDSFVPVIGAILERHGITGLTVRANELTWDGDRPVPAFPYHQSICTRCGNCKTSHLLRRDRPADTRKIYVGDGRSDICPAGFCEILFAKGSLLKHFAPLRPDCIPFGNLGAVHHHLRTLIP